MGVNDLWTVLSPFCERKPIHVLRKKTVAIDLAGWVCESMNVVDYFVSSKQYLRNLYFRTCYLILEDITPVFVLEGSAPMLKSQTMKKRCDNQFKGAKPKNKINEIVGKINDREKFHYILEHCKTLLNCIGVLCIQAPGEAEAYCALLNKNGLVDGIISQDSDCFAYGAMRVYRNFSISIFSKNSIGTNGTIDVYDMGVIQNSLHFGQNKIVVMALLSGCDYYPGGIAGIGRDGILKFLEKYREDEILERVRLWRQEDLKLTKHQISTSIKSKAIQVEVLLHNKLSDPTFPFEEIIKEYLSIPSLPLGLAIVLQQPKVVTFVKEVGPLLHWSQIYSFQKVLPILTRWQLRNIKHIDGTVDTVLSPKRIIRKCTIRGVPHLEILWKDENKLFNELALSLKFDNCERNNGFEDLWVTTEPFNLMEPFYKDLVKNFLILEESMKTEPRSKNCKLDDMNNDMILKDMKKIYICQKNGRQNVVGEHVKQNKNKCQTKISKFCKSTCTTPHNKCTDLRTDQRTNKRSQNLSHIIDFITSKDESSAELANHRGRRLNYEILKNI